MACLNGMLLPLPDAQRTWKARHIANVQARLADARRTLGIAWRCYDELEQLGGRLIGERMGEGESTVRPYAAVRMEVIDAKTTRSWRALGWSVAEQVTAVAAGRYTRAINARVFRAQDGAA